MFLNNFFLLNFAMHILNKMSQNLNIVEQRKKQSNHFIAYVSKRGKRKFLQIVQNLDRNVKSYFVIFSFAFLLLTVTLQCVGDHGSP